MRRWAARALAGAAILAPLLPAARADITESAWRDWDNGWSLRTVVGWESRPPNAPGPGEGARVAGGWYDAREGADSHCFVVVFGSFFGDAVPPGTPAPGPAPPPGTVPAPAPKPPPPPAPEKFPAYLRSWLDSLAKRTDGSGEVEGKEAPRRMGSDPGLLYEGVHRLRRLEGSRVDRREVVDTWRIAAAGARRGTFEVGVVYLVREATWRPHVRDSALSLRILDRRDMEARRAELEAKVRKAGGGDEGFLARVRARIPPGWKHIRRGDFVYIYDDGVATSAVESLARTLEGARKEVFLPAFPPLEDPASPVAVVKLTRDRRQYESYGAPAGSRGYWSSAKRELVLYEDVDYDAEIGSPGGTLVHEGFHQYVFHALDGVNAHPWFEEGFAQLFGDAGGDMRTRFTLERIREKAVADARKAGTFVPLARLLRMEWDPFYGRGKEAVSDIRLAYAEAWSFVHWLPDRAFPKAYFEALKGGVRAWRAAEAGAAAKEGRPAREAADMPPSDAEGIRAAAVAKALGGADLPGLEDRWRAATSR